MHQPKIQEMESRVENAVGYFETLPATVLYELLGIYINPVAALGSLNPETRANVLRAVNLGGFWRTLATRCFPNIKNLGPDSQNYFSSGRYDQQTYVSTPFDAAWYAHLKRLVSTMTRIQVSVATSSERSLIRDIPILSTSTCAEIFNRIHRMAFYFTNVENPQNSMETLEFGVDGIMYNRDQVDYDETDPIVSYIQSASPCTEVTFHEADWDLRNPNFADWMIYIRWNPSLLSQRDHDEWICGGFINVPSRQIVKTVRIEYIFEQRSRTFTITRELTLAEIFSMLSLAGHVMSIAPSWSRQTPIMYSPTWNGAGDRKLDDLWTTTPLFIIEVL